MTDHDETTEPLFDPDDDGGDTPIRTMPGPSQETARLIRDHLAEREAQGREPSWPDWDE